MESDIESQIIDIFKSNIEFEYSFEEAIDKPLISIGINSIMFLKIVVAIEVAFGIEFEPINLDFNKFSNIRSLVDYVKSKKVVLDDTSNFE